MGAAGTRAAAPVGGCRLIALATHGDDRGLLTVLSAGSGLPFAPARVFVVTDVPAGCSRGGHAHGRLEELLVCVRGAVTVEVDDGRAPGTVRLAATSEALLVPAGVWSRQCDFTADAVLVVLASLPYDADDHLPAPRA